MSVMITDNPVWDANCWYESQRDTRPVIGYCRDCGDELHGKEPGYDADVAYLLNDGSLLCGRCKRKLLDNLPRQVEIDGELIPEGELEEYFDSLYRL